MGYERGLNPIKEEIAMDKPDENYLVVKNQDLKYIGLEGVRSLDRIRRIIETRRNNETAGTP